MSVVFTTSSAQDTGMLQSSKNKAFFKCEASINAPKYVDVFMRDGGPINAVAARWQSDLSLSGSKVSVPVQFKGKKTSLVCIELPEDSYEFEDNGVVKLSSNMRLNAMSQRACCAINGTIGTSLSSESSEFLYNIFNGGGHHQMGMTYKTFVAHASSLAVSGAQIVAVDENGNETRCTPKFEKVSEA